MEAFQGDGVCYTIQSGASCDYDGGDVSASWFVVCVPGWLHVYRGSTLLTSEPLNVLVCCDGYSKAKLGAKLGDWRRRNKVGGADTFPSLASSEGNIAWF